ncbi:lectin C-type domain protein [Necator americanus]|uniref:Lectin C-type domain protein n=1 Tax=Necator americanus TaxID=51031 RepID=W2T7J4_NECAM|nr:lectin C-type domain protein [Necator americanus]ETN77823.1 lectin C-type domain protein [Necator americanus]
MLLWICGLLLVKLASGQFQFFTFESQAPLEDRFESLAAHIQDMDKQIARLQKKVAALEQTAHADWNATDSGSLYKVFEQRRTWSDAENYCQSLDAHLAVIDNESKNNFIKRLISEKNFEYAWIGVKTRSSSSSSHDTFSNFNKENPIDGCAVMDMSGIWSIHSCGQLRPFICQMVVL